MELAGLDRELAGVTELMLVSPVFVRSDLTAVIQQAERSGCRAVCLPSSRVEEAYEMIGDADLKLICLVGFPFGAAEADVKRFETEVAADFGVHEIELYINPGLIKDGRHREVLREMRDVVEAADERTVKITFEPRQLTSDELRLACRLAIDSGAHFIHLQQASIMPETVQIVRQLVGQEFGIKASGFRNFASAQPLLEAGATRLGYLEIRM